MSRTISPTVDVHIPSPNNPAIVRYSTLVASLQTVTPNLASTLFGWWFLWFAFEETGHVERMNHCWQPLIGLGLGCGFLVSSFHTIPRYSLRSSQIIWNISGHLEVFSLPTMTIQTSHDPSPPITSLVYTTLQSGLNLDSIRILCFSACTTPVVPILCRARIAASTILNKKLYSDAQLPD